MFITYDEKNGVEYAKINISKRVNGKVKKSYTNLGRVIDKQRGIYQNRERGVFMYDERTDTYSSAPANVVPATTHKEQLILDFGDVFFIDKYIKTTGLDKAIDAIGYGNPDTLYSMLCYYILCGMANCHAEDWWSGSYASIVYPKADLRSQRISDFLSSIGDEYSERGFFKEYSNLLKGKDIDLSSILIDSTGLPNSIHFPLTAINNHNGKISNEVRLIFIVQQETGLPIYFRYCPGNVIDVSTVLTSIAELKAQGINTKFAILDAGYYTGKNIDAFYDNGVSFITRLKENLTLYKKLIDENASSLAAKENLVSYNGRYVYIKSVPCKIEGHNAHAYVCLDVQHRSDENRKVMERASSKNMSTSEVYDEMNRQGYFVLVSSRRIACEKVLPLYYTRQQIEQVFDIGKNYADLLPLRVQNENTFRGHLLLTFIATTVIKLIQDELKSTSITPDSMFLNLRNQKCKVYVRKIVPQEAFKKVNDCYKIFKVTCPVTIPRQGIVGRKSTREL